ncbi:hypothetical protein CARUB_v10028098mg, partial [Capsella rubella]
RFISFLVPALKDQNINVFIDEQEERGKYLTSLFDRIGESKIALVIFSEDYTESKWCLDELVQIKECMDQNKLRVIPIFYNLIPPWDLEYRYQHKPEIPQKWKEAVVSVCQTFALSLSENIDNNLCGWIQSIRKANEYHLMTYPIRLIVEEVSKVLPEERNGQIGDIEVDNYSVPTSNLTLTLCEAPKTQLPGQSYELKIWVLERPRGNTFMIDARELSITWSHDSNHWTWLTLTNQSPNESAVEIAFLRNACWLDVAGKFDTRYLSPMTRYQVVFVVLLQYTKTEWKKPVKLKLVLPKGMGKPQERSVNMVNHITNEWVDILVGEFTTSNKNIGEISFVMYEHNSKMWKSGLFIKGVAIRPKY